jgi:hypothetical protein
VQQLGYPLTHCGGNTPVLTKGQSQGVWAGLERSDLGLWRRNPIYNSARGLSIRLWPRFAYHMQLREVWRGFSVFTCSGGSRHWGVLLHPSHSKASLGNRNTLFRIGHSG